jgi:tetratricopeptide (TPR) repeat protein
MLFSGNMRTVILLLCLFVLRPFVFSQDQAAIDSLNQIVAGNAVDTSKVAALLRLASQYYNDAPDKSYKYCLSAQEIAEKSNDDKSLYSVYGWLAYLKEQFGDINGALSYYKRALVITQKLNMKKDESTLLNNMGAIYKDLGRLDDALFFHNKSLKIKTQMGDKKGMSTSLNNMGLIFMKQGKIPQALDYYTKSLRLDEELKDSSGIATSLLNIGFVYKDQGNFSEARSFLRKSLSVFQKRKEKYSIGFALNAFGEFFYDTKNYDSAFYYYSEALSIRKEVGDKQGIANAEKNIGRIYEQSGNYTEAEKSYQNSLILFEELGDKWGMAFVTNRIGQICLSRKEFPAAETYLSTSLRLSKELGYPEQISNAAGNLWKLYTAKDNWKSALEMHVLYVTMRDSTNNEETKKAALKNHLKYEFEKKAAADSVKNFGEQKIKDAQLAAQHASLRQERTLRYALFGGLGLFAAFLVLVLNRFRVTRRQKRIIEEQKIMVDKAYDHLHEKNKELMDSIYYARRIQKALITSEKYIEKNLDRLMNRR